MFLILTFLVAPICICSGSHFLPRFCGILFEWIPRLSELYRICQSDEINRNRWDNLKIVLKGYQYITIDKRTRVPVHKRTHLRPPPLSPHIYMWWDIVRLSYISLRTSRHSFFPSMLLLHTFAVPCKYEYWGGGVGR